VSVQRWDPHSDYHRPYADIPQGAQTSEGDGWGWATVTHSGPCTEPGHRSDCWVLGYRDWVYTHRPKSVKVLSRLPLTPAASSR